MLQFYTAGTKNRTRREKLSRETGEGGYIYIYLYIYIYIYTGASESIDDLGHVNCELEERSHTRGNVTLCACACDNGMLGMAVRHYIYLLPVSST